MSWLKLLLLVVLLAALSLLAIERFGATGSPGSNAAPQAATRSAACAFALQAYDHFEAGQFDRERQARGLAMLGVARAADIEARGDGGEPCSLIAMSQAMINHAYRIGDRYRFTSYELNALGVAEKFAVRAVEQLPDEPMAHVQVAKLQMIRAQSREAWTALDRAYRLDPQSFHPWYLRAIISLQMGDVGRAKSYLDQGEKLASRAPHHLEFVAARRIAIAMEERDYAEAERWHRHLAEAHPPSATAIYNYALFLKSRERLDDALAQLQKAEKLRVFPALEKAKASVEAAIERREHAPSRP